MCPETRSDDCADQLSLVDTYKIALETRNLEINLFWQRSNYFLVLNTAIAVGFFSRGDQDKYSFLLALLGVGAAYLWLLINLGSKFWQSRWEHRLEVIEEKLPVPVGLFSAEWPEVRSDVESSFDRLRRTSRPVPKLARLAGQRLQALYLVEGSGGVDSPGPDLPRASHRAVRPPRTCLHAGRMKGPGPNDPLAQVARPP